jgi:hypothetical protein
MTFKEIRQADQTQKSEWEQEIAREMASGDRPFANPFAVSSRWSNYDFTALVTLISLPSTI